MLFASAWDHANQPSRSRDRPTVLLVGGVRCRAIFRSILSARGHEIIDAGEVREGVDLAAKLRPDLVMVEVDVGESGGWEAIRALKANLDTYLIPAVALSLVTLPPGTYRRARSAGYVDYITRPLEQRHILEVVSTWTRPSGMLVA